MKVPLRERLFELEVDASSFGAGAVLLQENKQGIDHRTLQNFEVYVGLSVLPVRAFTDQNPLVFLFQMPNSNQRLMRWTLLLCDFNLQINYKNSKDNVLADASSRSLELAI